MELILQHTNILILHKLKFKPVFSIKYNTIYKRSDANKLKTYRLSLNIQCL